MLKSTLILLLLATHTSITSCSDEKGIRYTKSEIAEKIITSIKENDYELFRSLLLSKDEIIEIIKDSEMGEKEKKQAIDNFNRRYAQNEEQFKASFLDLTRRCRQMDIENIDLSKIRYTEKNVPNIHLIQADIPATWQYDNGDDQIYHGTISYRLLEDNGGYIIVSEVKADY